MNFYNKDEIKKAISCKEMAIKLGAKINDNGTHCNAVWRDGDNPTAVSFDKNDSTRAYDHVKSTPLDVIEMFRIANNVTFIAASTMIGDELKLTPTSQQETVKRAKIVSEHIYTDNIGKPAHKVVRYEPKTFKQFEYINGDWKAGTENIKEFYPLYLQDWLIADTVYINEGEKACDACKSFGYNATTFAMGAGKWNDSYKQWFKDKHVVIISDNDDVGSKHARNLTWNLRDTARTIKIATISKKTKGDFADFKDDGGTKKQSDKIFKDAKFVNLRTLTAPEDIIFQSKRDIARNANLKPFRNYTVDFIDKETKKKNGDVVITKKAEYEALSQSDMVDDLHNRMLDFPRMIGESLFDYDIDGKKINRITNTADMLSVIGRVTGHNPDFKGRMDGAVMPEMFYSALRFQSKYRYNTISKTPSYPERDDVFCMNQELPEPSNGEYYFDKLVSFFNPSTESDRIILKAAIATVFWYRPHIKRPAFIISTEKGGGQGIGKTTFVEKLALLCDEEPLRATKEHLKNESGLQELEKRIISDTGREKRIFLLDNMTGFFRNQSFADFLTRSSYSGRPAFGRGEETRFNDLTYFITANSASFDRDIIHRSFIINLAKPKKVNKNWDYEVTNFINAHRFQIISDIIQTLKNNAKFECTPVTRNKPWEVEVLQKMLETKEHHEVLIDDLEIKARRADGESETAREIINFFYYRIGQIESEMGEIYDPEKDVIWLANSIVDQWCKLAVPSLGGRSGRSNACHIVKQLIETHACPDVSRLSADRDTWQIGDWMSDDMFSAPRYPTKTKEINGKIVKPMTGLMWNAPLYKLDKGKYARKIKIISEDSIVKNKYKNNNSY